MSAATCGGCDARWQQSGNRIGHCAECHRTFSGISCFDAHQRIVNDRNVCLDPATLVTQAGEARYKTAFDRLGATYWRSAKSDPRWDS